MMTPVKDYYAILGIPRDASQSEIERHYHALAKKWHPDLNRDPDATQRMQALNEAYAVLSDPLLRARYDAIHGTPNWTVAPGPFGISSVTLRNVSSLFG